MKLREYVEGGRRSGRGLYRVLREAYERVGKGEIRLVDPSPPKTFSGYLSRPAYNLWLYTALALAAATLAVIPLSESHPRVLPARYVLGSIYVLFLPGYSLVEALYPEEGSLSPLERLALSIGLSLAVVPLIGLALNYTPWGIRLKPYVAASSALIVTLLLVAAYRKYQLVKAKNRLGSLEALGGEGGPKGAGGAA